MAGSERLREVATAASDDVRAVLLVGSVASGHADERSDVDLQVVGPGEASEWTVDGVHVEWNPVTEREIEETLADWEDDAALYTYATADLLYDEAGLAGVLAAHDEYPPDVLREKRYAGWFYGTGDVFDARKADARDDERVRRAAAVSAVEQFVALAYLLDGEFPPYRKWRFRDLPLDLPGVDAALAGDVDALEEIQGVLEPELRGVLAAERVEKPYLH